MTLDDLELRVAILGNNSPITSETLFLESVNRALRRLHNDIVIPKEVRIAARNVKPISYHKEIYCKNGQFMEFPLNGAAYSMRFLGSGKYMITDGGVTNTYSVDSQQEAKLIKGFMTFGGKISFWGSFSFTVYDFAVYGEMLSPNVRDIPEYGSRRVFDLKAMYGDFMSFISPPTDKHGKPIPSCVLREGRLELDSDFEGEIILSYRRLPTEVFSSIATLYIDVPDEYLHLFSLLVAAYYWYYTDESLSKYYESLYEEGVESTKKSIYGSINSAYIDTNGWA